MSAHLLEVDGIGQAFGGLQVLDDLSFVVQDGEIATLIGPNGAGKSTVLNVVSGLYAPTRGDVRFEGRSIVGLSPDAVVRRGVARTFQSLRLFLNMTVVENVMAAAYVRTQTGLWQGILRTPEFRREEARIRQQAEEKLAFFGTRLQGFRHDQPAYTLSYANRRRLEIARAMATEPRLLLLDEPAAGMNPHETEELADLILDLRRRGGYSILLVEHDMALVERVSDRVIALDRGCKIAEGSFLDVTGSPVVVSAYLGVGDVAG
jgi:branched-chain amino acid transport system ATP-binding protein